MSAITFDTLKFANHLKAAGAEPKPASRADVKETEAALRLEIERLRTETQKTIAEAKTDTLKWGAGMLLAQAGLIAALVKLL